MGVVVRILLFYQNFKMLERPGDLIPVQGNATTIPWTKRRSQILNFLHRGPVTFNTLVYDTNVGDISSLATYFNPDRNLNPNQMQVKAQRTLNWVLASQEGQEVSRPSSLPQIVLACQEGLEGDGKEELRPSSVPLASSG